MPTGTTVRLVDEERGRDFISTDDKEPKVFVHLSAVREAGLGSLEKGQRWVFDIAPDVTGRPRAINLRFEP